MRVSSNGESRRVLREDNWGCQYSLWIRGIEEPLGNRVFNTLGGGEGGAQKSWEKSEGQ